MSTTTSTPKRSGSRSKAPQSPTPRPRRTRPKTESTKTRATKPKPRTKRKIPRRGPPAAPAIPIEAEVVEVRDVSLARRLWRRSRAYVSWAIIIGLALLDPGLILAAIFVSLLAAASFFCLGVIATTITTVALLKQWFPEHLRHIEVTPPHRR